MATDDRCVTILPYFRVHPGKMDEFKVLSQRFVAKAELEPECLYYGYCYDGDEAHCREGYVDAEALLFHLEHVDAILKEAAQIADLVRLELQGIPEELEKLRGPLAHLKPRYFELEYGFRR